MLEQVGDLPVDLERILIIEQVDVEPFHMDTLTNTNDYTFRVGTQPGIASVIHRRFDKMNSVQKRLSPSHPAS